MHNVSVSVGKRLSFSRVAPVIYLASLGSFSGYLNSLESFHCAPLSHMSPQEVFLEILTTIASDIVISLHQHACSFKGDVLIIKNCAAAPRERNPPEVSEMLHSRLLPGCL